MNKSITQVLRHAAGVLATTLLLTPGVQAAPRGFDSVSVTAINYTGRDLNGVLFINPDNKDDVAGGAPVQPFAGSGGMCCYALPHKWSPGIKVKVRYDWWGGTSKRDFQFLTVDVPPYPTDEPGTLWALFYEDGTIEVLASAVDPGHAKWPGKFNHWPLPDREHRLKVWQIEYEQMTSSAEDAKRMMSELSESEAEDFWRVRERHEPNAIKGFSGPNDPKFLEYLKRRGASRYDRAHERMKELESIKP